MAKFGPKVKDEVLKQKVELNLTKRGIRPPCRVTVSVSKGSSDSLRHPAVRTAAEDGYQSRSGSAGCAARRRSDAGAEIDGRLARFRKISRKAETPLSCGIRLGWLLSLPKMAVKT